MGFRYPRIPGWSRLSGEVPQTLCHGLGAQARHSHGPQDASFKLFRDGIQGSKCSCGTIQCEHLAALVIWWMARGSLLRAGILDEEAGTSNKAAPKTKEKATATAAPSAAVLPVRKNMPVAATPVTYVHFIRRDDNVIGVSLEPALKYVDPVSKKNRLEIIRILVRMMRPGGSPPPVLF